MKYLACDFYEDFKCIGSRCPYTCCAGGWDIIIDPKTKTIYDHIDGEFGKALKQNIHSVKDSSFQFILTKDGRCPFLTQENLCEIYQKLGPENMCSTCRNYPRTSVEYGDISFYTLTLSCPEVSRILLNRTAPISFLFGEDDTNEANDNSEGFDWNFFNTLMSCFTLSIELMQNRAYTLSTRLRLLLIFTSTLQMLLDEQKDVSPLLETFSSPDYLQTQAKTLSALPSNIPAIFSAFLRHCQISEGLKNRPHLVNITRAADEFILSCKGEQLLSRISNGIHLLSTPAYDIQYEHLCVYFLFRYYFRAYENKDPLEEVAQLIYLLLVYRGYALPFCSDKEGIPIEKQISLFSSISRSFDHNVQNLSILSAAFKKDGQQDINLLLSLI